MHNLFQPVIDIANLMADFPQPWFISGGWAIDLFLGKVTRSHSDIEIGIYRCDQFALAHHLTGWQLKKALPNGQGEWVAWMADQQLFLPTFQIKANHPDKNPTEIEFFLNERNATHWISRRHDNLTRPLETVSIAAAFSLPILSPDIQLLYKAKHTRPKDQADFDLAFPRLDGSKKQWLADTLATYHPGHIWMQAM